MHTDTSWVWRVFFVCLFVIVVVVVLSEHRHSDV